MSHHHQYHLADDCPNCGQNDGLWEWKGARMCRTDWGHDYMCCSDKCGREFLNSEKYKAKEKSRIREQIGALTAQLRKLGA